tara:strand:+ start:435 stop:701 length:267 start_codon:yes stop_codon:yes gene_type:complete
MNTKDYQRIMKLPLDCTSKTMGPKTFAAYTAEMMKGNQAEIIKLIKFLHPAIYEKEINDKVMKYNSYRTEYHLIFIDNSTLHYFFKLK